MTTAIMTIDQLRGYRKMKSQANALKAQRADLILSTVHTEDQTVHKKREKLDQSIQRIESEMSRIRQYISRCDEYYAVLLELHYVRGKTWRTIALRMGGGNTADGVRRACHRYVKKHGSK